MSKIIQLRPSRKTSLDLAPITASKTLVTAIPQDDRHWRLKAISPTGETVILAGIYFSRLAALGQAVLVAEQCGGEVRP